MEAYYKKQLDNLIIDDSIISVKFYGATKNGCLLNTLNINLDSIKDIKKILSKIEKQLIKNQIKENDKILKA